MLLSFPESAPPVDEGLDPDLFDNVRALRQHLSRFMLSYQFAIQEVETKIKILQQEFQVLHHYNPIEHVTTRLKSIESVINKAARKGCGPDTEQIREQILDIAGVRVVCSFTSDVYRMQEMICAQDDVEVVQVKDYIAAPKASGYRSLHAIIRIPVFLSNEVVQVPVELQFRTIAQDFWASLEHKIFYKYEADVPGDVTGRLHEAAQAAAQLDAEMESLSVEVQELSDGNGRRVSDESVRAFLGLLDPDR